MTDVILILEQ